MVTLSASLDTMWTLPEWPEVRQSYVKSDATTIFAGPSSPNARMESPCELAGIARASLPVSTL